MGKFDDGIKQYKLGRLKIINQIPVGGVNNFVYPLFPGKYLVS